MSLLAASIGLPGSKYKLTYCFATLAAVKRLIQYNSPQIGLSTGHASAFHLLFDLKDRDFKLAINLKYSTNGVRVDVQDVRLATSYNTKPDKFNLTPIYLQLQRQPTNPVTGLTSSAYTYDANGNTKYGARNSKAFAYNQLNLSQTVLANALV
ncbi:hypothetical protein [Mucilaginibacter sp. UR6-11]|uniref:hypothetical protein n=1 Tax=Mucilaginibacter sp. UR6-11 TaxID=1435644 RepID=UPI001E653A29|nr:hypothetical protein [Mucilaginibacter sp. UR6-11]MCC8427250.1 hypothetical protein [Mucilaginibacter sp. UR6-11]